MSRRRRSATSSRRTQRVFKSDSYGTGRASSRTPQSGPRSSVASALSPATMARVAASVVRVSYAAQAAKTRREALWEAKRADRVARVVADQRARGVVSLARIQARYSSVRAARVRSERPFLSRGNTPCRKRYMRRVMMFVLRKAGLRWGFGIKFPFKRSAMSNYSCR